MTSFTILWEKSLKSIQNFFAQNNNSIAFDNYIKALKPEFEDDGKLFFTASSEHVRDMVMQRFSKNIADICADTALDITGVPRIYEINILTSTEMDSLLIDRRGLSVPKYKNSITLNSSYTFKNFVVGNANSIASTAAFTVAESPGEAYNPLFIYGGVGLGKTHLMHAIGNEIIKNNPYANVIYITSETFLNEYIEGIMIKNTEKFKNKYRNADVLLIDDIQFINRSEATQEELYHTFNTLYEQQKQIVFTSDKPPSDIPNLEERLISRFNWGLITDIGMPDFETKVAIIHSKLPAIKEATKCTMDFSEEVIHYIASKEKGNVRDIEGALKRVIAHAKIMGMNSSSPIYEIDMPMAEEALRYFFVNPASKEVTPKMIIKNTCEYFDISESDILSSKKNRELAFPRQICMYLLRHMLNLAYPKIGELMGGRHYSTVMFAFDKINDLLKTDADLKSTINNIMHRIKE